MPLKKSAIQEKKNEIQKKNGMVKLKLSPKRKRNDSTGEKKEVPISNLAEVLSWQL